MSEAPRTRSRLEQPGSYATHPSDWGRRALPAFCRPIARAVAEALLADEDERGNLVAPSDAALDHCVDTLDTWLGHASPELAKGFVALSLAMEALPLAVIGKPSRCTRLALADRVHYLEALEGHRSGLFAMLAVAFKVPLCVPIFEQADGLAETGFDRPTLAHRRKLDVVASEPAEVAR